ncbi:MAG: histidinol-phosphate transaminase, partial [Lachnospiraceae bacterium]|nr:histidinol-phosphate transaminase [Candidatus Equihabitans merdae]
MSWRDNVRSCEPYVAGEQPKDPQMIKLNTNENPYPPSPLVEKVLQEMKVDEMRLYPDPTVGTLVHALAARYRVKDSQVFVGVGSDDVLAMIFMTFFNSDKPILFPDISYSFYPVWAEMLKIPYKTVPLDERFRIRPEDYLEENGGVVFPNPNAPTGQALPISEVEELVKANADSLVVVDEAYVDFGTESAISLVDRYDNLIVVQTFSKSRSLAGMRIGFAIASEEIISCLNTIKYSFNSYTMNRPAIAVGCAAV